MHTCSHHIITNATTGQYDPTRTITLRRAFVMAMRRRFKELVKVVKITVDERDCFGLRDPQVYQMTPAGRMAFTFPRSQDKVTAFMEWFNIQVNRGILEEGVIRQMGQGIENQWTDRYITDSYKKGYIRAQYEIKKAGGRLGEDTLGVEGMLQTPIHMDRLGLLYSRVYSDLKGITAAMDTQISRVLTQGIADGDNPRLLARKLVATINGVGAGELGITDSLGRYIPASRRAETLARTEVIRAHHQATIQEYRNWGVEGVTVRAEWQTVGDDRVCQECMSMEGRVFNLDEIMNMIPLHPNCFIDPQIPIYTSEGWKPIGKIKVGDLVLTHKYRFRKVTHLIHTPKQMPEVVRFKFKGDLHLSMTVEHPVLIGQNDIFSAWKDAGSLRQGDKVKVLANECKRCGAKIPYFRTYCSRTCLSLNITDKQWADPEHRQNMSNKATKQMHREYLLGTRDRFKITEQANIRTRELVKEENWILQNKEIRELGRHLTNTSELKKAASVRMKKNNPMHDPITVEKVKNALQDLYTNHPEKRLNARMAKHRKSGKQTWIEQRMAQLLDKLGVNYVFQYPILRYNVDFAIPELNIVIECDGDYWHQDKVYDDKRQKNIENEGWDVFRFSGTRINQQLSQIEEELSRVLCNHLGEYGSVNLEIESIKRWTLKQPRTLYNFSVEEDESYIAKGIVVHNCRCMALPRINN